MSQWANKYKLNISLLNVHYHYTNIIQSKYYIYNIQLENVNYNNYLGIIFKNILNKYTDYICKKKLYVSLNSILDSSLQIHLDHY